MSIFALIDCNNFYASCERVFNPKMEKKPIVVLSNNDGCIIARSYEAKKLKIPMGAPFYQWKDFLHKERVQVFSSNYALYGDLSCRVMSILESFCPKIEIYSIDEAFLSLNEFTQYDLNNYTMKIKNAIKMWVGIPVSIGIAPTKTLAKIANYMAKKSASNNIFNLCSPDVREAVLQEFPIENIWGIGRQLAKKLKRYGINNAGELRNANPKQLRKKFSVIMERIILELQCVSCIPLETMQSRKQIMFSRSFGKSIASLNDMEEAISHYTAKACIKLREQLSCANGILVFLQTNVFRAEKYYANSTFYNFPVPSSNTSYIMQMAKSCLHRIFKSGYCYNKAGIILLDLMPTSLHQYDLYHTENSKQSDLEKTIDKINKILGKGSIFFASEGLVRSWQLRSSMMSPRYTTQWPELPRAACLDQEIK